MKVGFCSRSSSLCWLQLPKAYCFNNLATNKVSYDICCSERAAKRFLRSLVVAYDKLPKVLRTVVTFILYHVYSPYQIRKYARETCPTGPHFYMRAIGRSPILPQFELLGSEAIHGAKASSRSFLTIQRQAASSRKYVKNIVCI